MSEALPTVSLETQPELLRTPLVSNDRSLDWISEKISSICEERTPFWWWVAFLITSPIACFGLICIGYQISNGVGVWGENHPVGWAWDITNFVFWIGIGHAGTLISAIFFLARQKWRTSINRAAEAMTLFAVICAAIFPGIHVGRVWMAWFLAPIPEFQRHLAELPLAAALGRVRGLDLLHGLGALLVHGPHSRPRHACAIARSRARAAISTASSPSAGAVRTATGATTRWRTCILAGISTPLVLSVHSVVSFDFATSIMPGWHTTIFPPYFVAGAIFGGFAMVLTIMLPATPPLSAAQGPHHPRPRGQDGQDHPAHGLDRRLRLHHGVLHRLLRRERFEAFTFFHQRFNWDGSGWYQPVLLVHVHLQRHLAADLLVQAGRAATRSSSSSSASSSTSACGSSASSSSCTSLAQDFLPSSWGHYYPSWVEIWTFIGTFGIFLSLFLLFMRFLPMIAMSEVKIVTPFADPHAYIPDSGVGIGAHHPIEAESHTHKPS